MSWEYYGQQSLQIQSMNGPTIHNVNLHAGPVCTNTAGQDLVKDNGKETISNGRNNIGKSMVLKINVVSNSGEEVSLARQKCYFW